MKTNELFLLQHGNYGEGPINAFLVSESSLDLLKKVREIAGNYISGITSIFDQGGCIHITLSKPLEYNGFMYNMFFIDRIKGI